MLRKVLKKEVQTGEMKTRRARQDEAAAADKAANTRNKRKRKNGSKRTALGDVNPNEDRINASSSGAKKKKRRKHTHRAATLQL